MTPGRIDRPEDRAGIWTPPENQAQVKGSHRHSPQAQAEDRDCRQAQPRNHSIHRVQSQDHRVRYPIHYPASSQTKPMMRVGLGDYPEVRYDQFSSASSDTDDEAKTSSFTECQVTVSSKRKKLPENADEQQMCCLSNVSSTSESHHRRHARKCTDFH